MVYKTYSTREAFRRAILDFDENHEKYNWREYQNLPQNPDAPDENGADAAMSQPAVLQDDCAGEGSPSIDDGSGV